MWESLIDKAKGGGLDVVDTYVFWNLHEPSPGIVLFIMCLFDNYLFFIFYLQNLKIKIKVNLIILSFLNCTCFSP